MQRALELRTMQMFAFEYVAYTPLPDRGGKTLRIPLEDDAILLEVGMQLLHPANHRVLVGRQESSIERASARARRCAPRASFLNC